MGTTKILLVLACVCVAVLAYPQGTPGKRMIIPLLQREYVRDDYGQYTSSYLGGDGTSGTEVGYLKLNNDKTDYVLVKKGSVRYTAPDGTPIALDWVADENGFRATGNHLPVVVVPAA